ncbi:hypothetical protein [Yersinia intermedia]|uniref:hypothetical protein n=1 Tax=Yersinia intermedia TaxID=631 RepID=UPI001F52E55A|nr:hypothetical protein [Yersinia intermedia]UNK24180.1 hypothetical protein MNQ97_04040 [Yersinia intermedia]
MILLPDGSTALTNNAHVIWTAKPSEFTLAPLTSGLTYTDEDGDLPSGTAITLANPPGVTWTWKNGATALTDDQLSQPLQSNFAGGTVLTVSVSTPVNVTAVSGLPNSGSQTFVTPTFNVVVKAPPTIYVNGTPFAIDAGFPKTGFVGANFQFYMNGTNAVDNGTYTYTTNQPGWTTVSSTGVVTFTRMPTAAEKAVTITITDTTGVDAPRDYAFTPDLWFVNRGNTKNTPAQADTYCVGLGATPSHTVMSSGSRAADGRLWDEWGSMSAYGTDAGWNSSGYWAKEKELGGSYRYYVLLSSGVVGNARSDGTYYVACSRSL